MLATLTDWWRYGAEHGCWTVPWFDVHGPPFSGKRLPLDDIPGLGVHVIEVRSERHVPEASTAERLDLDAPVQGPQTAADRVAGPAPSTRAVDRALTLLAEVAAGPVTLSEAARRSALAPSTALRLLRTLESGGFVARDGDGTFRAGGRLLQLGAQALGRQTLVDRVLPSLQHIVERTGESAYFVIRGAGDTALYLAMVEGTHAIRHTSWVGRAIALEDLAVGMALSGRTSTSGYLAQRDRLEPDVTAIAAPVRWTGGVLGALNLLGPTYRIDEVRMHAYGKIVADEARALGRLIGSPDPVADPVGVPTAGTGGSGAPSTEVEPGPDARSRGGVSR